MTNAMCVSACSLLVAVMAVLVVGGGTLSNRPEVRRDVHEATIHTATCSTDNVHTKHKTKIISIDLTRQTELDVYLARVSTKTPCASRNKIFNKTVAARGCLNTTGTSNVNVSLVQSTSLDLKMDGAKCKYWFAGEKGPNVEDARVAFLLAKKFEWTIDSLPEAASATIVLPTGGGQKVFFVSAESQLDSLEFLHPKQPNDPTMYMWRHNSEKGVISLTVFAARDSPLVTNAGHDFECRVKTSSTDSPCVYSHAPAVSKGGGIEDWLLVVIVGVVCVVAVTVAAVVCVVLRRRRRRRRRRESSVPIAVTDNKANVKLEMAESVQASDDVDLNDPEDGVADDSALRLVMVDDKKPS